MTTPKSLRTAPPRLFERYTLFKATDGSAGLTPITNIAMTPLQAGQTHSGSYSISTGFADDATSAVTEIGFDFEFDGVTYKHFIANTNGFLVLCDPSLTPTTTPVSTFLSHVLTVGTSTELNQNINLTNTSQSVLLCPWFDDLKIVSDSISKLSLSSAHITRVSEGLQPHPAHVSATGAGVRMFREKNSRFGRRTIVRWNAISNWTLFGAPDLDFVSILRFEVVLYENGTIEFRYGSKGDRRDTASDATVGIFMPGTNNFRDFSEGLGYRDGERNVHAFGGTIYAENASFVDTVDTVDRPYVGNLDFAVHWPGTTGAVLSFIPPQNKRRILPLKQHSADANRSVLPSVLRTGDKRSGRSDLMFDDRKSVNFISGTIVSYPTTFRPFKNLGNTNSNVRSQLDLYPNGIETEGRTEKWAIEQFLGENDETSIVPFDEANRFEQGSPEDPFFAFGSTIERAQNMRSKTHVRFSLPIDVPIKMFGISSSIYYYNKNTKAFNIPSNSTTPIGVIDNTGGASDIANAQSHVIAGRIPEDFRGFGPIGNVLGSGSNEPSGIIGTSPYINSPYTPSNSIVAIQRDLSKSVSKNPEYSAAKDETFTIPINQPFVLEKAVIEVPFAMGNGWFQDKTATNVPFMAGVDEDVRRSLFDIGGPGITVSLFNQLTIGNNSRRDLILSGTITHEFDNKSELVMTRTGSTGEIQVRMEGFNAYGTPSSIVVPKQDASGYCFTGSVAVKSEALISNGVMLSLTKTFSGSSDEESREGIRSFLSNPTLKLVSSSGDFSNCLNIAYVNSLGRGQTSFDPSGRSVDGKEFSTSQKVVTNNNEVDNPFYTPMLSAFHEETIDTQTEFFANTLINLEASERSPYLLLPGDNLILAVSKTRPVYHGNMPGMEPFSGSSHDVALITGSVNITLYGTLLRENKEISFGLNQELTSDAIHEMIGSEPITDQYDVFYRDELIGGMFDDYITGSMFNVNIVDSRKILTTGSNGITQTRGRVFSKHRARLQPPPDESAAEVLANPSKAFRIQPWYERVGTSYFSEFVCNSERYYDSMLPDISEIVKTNGGFISNNPPRPFVNSIDKISRGIIIFDSADHFSPFTDKTWTKAFPYEPKYRHIGRNRNQTQEFIIDRELNESGALVQIHPRVISNLHIGTAGMFAQGESQFFGQNVGSIGTPQWAPWSNMHFWFTDVNHSRFLSGTSGDLLTGSATTDDQLRILYGFGDMNTYSYFRNFADETEIIGTTGTRHWPDFIDAESKNSLRTTQNIFLFKPIIRGWKYGLSHGLPTFSKLYFRRGCYGQLRDMLEQRPFTAFYKFAEQGTRQRNHLGLNPIEVQFIDSEGNRASPEDTTSHNLSLNCTSSLPYFDGIARNR